MASRPNSNRDFQRRLLLSDKLVCWPLYCAGLWVVDIVAEAFPIRMLAGKPGQWVSSDIRHWHCDSVRTPIGDNMPHAFHICLVIHIMRQ